MSAICSLFAFAVVAGKHHHSPVDIDITYLLLLGAISMDVYSFLMHVVSAWAMILVPVPYNKVRKMYARIVASRFHCIKAKSRIRSVRNII